MTARPLLLTLLAALLASSCTCTSGRQNTTLEPVASRPTAVTPTVPDDLTAVTQGLPYSLQLESGTLDFCDDRGNRQLDLRTKRDSSGNKPCHRSEENVSCSGLPMDIVVRAPQSVPDDVLEINGTVFRLRGRVHDCVVDGKKVAVVTGSSVVLIDVEKGTTTQISPTGGERVAMGFNWIAWAEDSTLRVVALNRKRE